MPQDAYTLRYLCEELNELLSGGKINRVVQTSADEVVFTVYTGRNTERLLIDVSPSHPRIGITEEESDSPLTAPNFCMLLRKHALNAVIEKISLIGFDRIVKIDLICSGEFSFGEKKTLYAELMGRYSNVILTENGKVLGGNRGINCFDDGVRPLIVGREYKFPPVGEKKLPSDEAIIDFFDGCEKDSFARKIIECVQGIALSTAEEISDGYFSACGEKNADNARLSSNGTAQTTHSKLTNEKSDIVEKEIVCGKEAFDFLNFFLYKKEYSPCVIEKNGEVTDVCVFPYKRAVGKPVAFEKLYKAEEFYFKEKSKIRDFNRLKERLTSIVSSAQKKAAKRLSAINAREKEALNAEENRISGELILANIYKIKQGDKSCTVLNYYDGKETLISLDVKLSPAKNAEAYYKKYNKQKRTVIALAPQKESAEKEFEYLSSVADFISIAETSSDLVAINEELISEKIIVPKTENRRKKIASVIGREYEIFGFKVRAGRNNTENEKIAFSAKPSDMWLHAKDYHSSHIIIYTEDKVLPDAVLTEAAKICAYYSKGREGGKTEVVYTLRKNVKKPPHSKTGFCTYTDFKSITVCADNGERFLKTSEEKK